MSGQVVAVVADVAPEPGFLSCTSKQLKRFVGLGQSGPSVFISFCSGVCHSISHASGGFSLHIIKLLITSCLFEIRVDRYAHRSCMQRYDVTAAALYCTFILHEIKRFE